MGNISLRIWNTYGNYVRQRVLPDSNCELKDMLYWRNEIFLKMLIYLLPVCIISLIPGVYMSFQCDFKLVGTADLLAFASLIVIVLNRSLTLGQRKIIFISIFYVLSFVLIFYVIISGVGMLYMLALTTIIAVIYSIRAAYYSVLINIAVCISFALIIHFGGNLSANGGYTAAAWIAISSNLILLSFVCTLCLELLMEGLEGTMRDKIAAKKAVKMLNNRLLLATGTAGIGIWEWDIKTNHLSWDEAMHKLYETDDQYGSVYENWLSRLHPGDRDRTDMDIKNALLGIKNYDTEFRIIWNDHSIHYIRATGTVERDEDGTILRMIGANWDITILRNALLEIQKLNEGLELEVAKRTAELENANKELEAFSYSVSHDLRAPVRAMMGFTQIIRHEYGDTLNDDVREMFKYIEDSSKRMNTIINDLLALAMYGKERMNFSEVDLNVLFKDVWDTILFTSPHHAILDMDPMPVVYADRSMLQQVIVNILSNSIKYSSKKAEPTVSIGYIGSPEFLTIYVQDNGAGFDMNQYDRLFGAFQRLHGENEFEGTGVGLMITKKIINRHGGAIWAEGKVDQGATFYFSLPTAA